MKQEFLCKTCGLESRVELPNGLEEDAIVAFRAYQAEHDRLSPHCRRAAKLVADLENLIIEGVWPHSPQAGVLN